MRGSSIFRLIVSIALVLSANYLLAQEETSNAEAKENTNTFTDRIQESVVFSAKVGQIDADASMYRAYTNAEISGELNHFHTLTPHERRELLLEVSRRIRVEGDFVVEKNVQHFGSVVSRSSSGTSEEDSEGPKLEEVMVARVQSGELSEEELERLRRENAAKQQRPPAVRVNSGRAYSQ